MTAKASKTARLPDNTDFIFGSTLLHIYQTAWYALVDRARLQAGETVLVTGASGGVGLACVELAHLLGARVIAAVGNAAKEMVVREYGADEVIDYSREDVRERVKALLDCCALYRRRMASSGMRWTRGRTMQFDPKHLHIAKGIRERAERRRYRYVVVGALLALISLSIMAVSVGAIFGGGR